MRHLTPDRWRRIDELFARALELAPADRNAFLREQVGSDDDLLEEVLALLRVDTAAAAALGESATDFAASVLPDDADADEALPPGTRVGAYRIERELGRGGMGTVYQAERTDEFRMRVAIKVVKRGMDTDEVLRRFRSERQILALLNHPNIATLHDGGATTDGRPYLVMECIEGQPIDEYCDVRRLDIEERLRLFSTVCQAVQYAHQNLVIHRDIKPSNVLVSDDGEIKLLDFGIAKLLDTHPAAEELTRTQLRRLTPEFASPEQLAGMPLTTTADVYGLGVLLFRLLTGRHPFGMERSSTPEEWRVARQRPPRPSAALRDEPSPGSRSGSRVAIDCAQIAAARRLSPDRLERRLRGDLDTIVLRALEWEPDRRYASAQQLLEDVERHLSGLPIRARGATRMYRARKFVARHRVAVTAAVLVVVSLSAGLGSSLWQAQRAATERDLARTEAAKAQATLGFLQELFEGADPNASMGDTLTVFELLDRGAVRLDDQTALPTPVRARLAGVVGRLYLKLGAYDRARPLLERAVELQRSLDPHTAATAAALGDLAELAVKEGSRDETDALFGAAFEALDRAGRVEPADRARLLNTRGMTLLEMGRLDEAEQRFGEAMGLIETAPGDHRQLLADSRFGLATVLLRHGEYDRAEPLFQEVLGTRRAIFGDLNSQVVDVLNNLGNVYQNRRDFAAADSALREALALRRRLVGPDHPDVSLALNNLALVAHDFGRYDEADAMLRESIDILERRVGREHRDVAMSLSNFAYLNMVRGNHAVAERVFLESLGIMRRTSGPVSADAGLLLGNLGTLMADQERHAEAERYLREALRVRMQVHGEVSMHAAWRRFALAEALRKLGRAAEAEREHAASVAIRRKLQGENHRETARGLYGLGGALYDQGRFTEAEALYRRSLEIYRAEFAEDHANVALAKRLVAEALIAQRRYADAEPLLLESYEAVRADATAPREHGRVRAQLRRLYAEQGLAERAAAFRD